MSGRRRSALQTMAIALAVVAGLLIAMRLMGRFMTPRAEAQAIDLTVVDATPAELAAQGMRFGEGAPRTWSAISIRRFADERGTVNLLRCRIAAEEAGILTAFPPDSRRPLGDRPPADWPWGGAGDPYAVPTWWDPHPARSRLYEAQPADGPARGIYAGYDPATGILHVWTWVRSDVRLVRPAPGVIADQVAMVLADEAVRARRPSTPGGWIPLDRLPAAAIPELAPLLPAGAMISADLLPLRDRPRYLLRIDGIDEAAARALCTGTPLRPLTADAPPPVAAWGAALPEGGTLPAWFAPGAGPRGVHCLVALASGAVERGRWFAFDPAVRAVFIWDWQQDAAPLPPSADLAASAADGAPGPTLTP